MGKKETEINMTATQIIWLSKKEGTFFMQQFMKKLKASGFKSKCRSPRGFIEDVVTKNFEERAEDIIKCFRGVNK